VILASLVQTTWPDSLKIRGAGPDFVLLFVVFFAIVEGEERAMYTALIGGLYQDVTVNTLLGHHVLCLVLVAYGIGRFSTRLVTDHPAVKVGLVFVASLAQGVLFNGVLYIIEPDMKFLYSLIQIVIPVAFFSGILTPFLFVPLERIFQGRQSFQGGAG
jgi:rod shape-determining protein MreD